ncbi:RluA family pseudouridine synthase [Variovorax sp. PCZ-1]|uniref:RluA family pseudouridine synthase n=1 Tax=Variovorax sp. PCZ-1 TaxID=2835533 RepID=UPI001BCA9926|nr:RluA family pseudouridine synthase [Variovorax sp. PCZ-1]MBS7809101.1 RluA family pseudouridine synthase [Variovorax sp. PCZ-1]
MVEALPKVALLQIDTSSEGQRLDNFLLRVCKGVPKTHVYRIIRSGEVRINKGRAQVDTRLAVGDVVRIPPIRLTDDAAPEATQQQSGPANTPPREFPILFEDDHLLAIDKPAGVAVHGGSGVNFGVIEQLRRARPQAKFLELVHRLDRDTSGILLIAKRRSALVNLQAQFKARETGKTYLALVKGTWPAKLKVIDLPLHKYLVNGGEDDGERRVKVVAKDDPDGMRSITLVKIAKLYTLPNGEQASLLEVTIKTGRTHQIRVHLAHHGHPIIGDEKYGDFELNKALVKAGMKRMYLHAWQLEFLHPANSQTMTLNSASPF